MAIPMTTHAPLRDALFDHLNAVIEERWPDRAECRDCAASVEGECDDHQEDRVRCQEYGDLQRRIGAAKNDNELVTILAALNDKPTGRAA